MVKHFNGPYILLGALNPQHFSHCRHLFIIDPADDVGLQPSQRNYSRTPRAIPRNSPTLTPCPPRPVGCVTNTFGVPGVSEHALFLKELNDARRIRERLICNLERAALPGVGDEERRRLLHFVAVGAGPTGVRFAAELYDLLVTDLPR